MEIVARGEQIDKLETVLTRHKGETIEWHANTYNRGNMTDIGHMFDNINAFIGRLPPDTQDDIWDCFCNIKSIMDEVGHTTRLRELVRGFVSRLYSHLSFDQLREYLRLYGKVQIPENLQADYSGIDDPLTQKLTYPQNDYFDLIVLSVLLKPMVPIFGEYIWKSERFDGAQFKERFAMGLLSESHVIQQPAFDRLYTYIDARVFKERRDRSEQVNKSSMVFGGLGIDELPEWLFSLLLVRRVCIHEEKTPDNIVANIFNRADQKISKPDRTFREHIKDKPLMGGKTEEDNTSVAENYKVREKIAAGDLRALSVVTHDVQRMADRVEMRIDPQRLKRCLDETLAHETIPISDHQIILVQWVMKPVMAARGVPYLDKPALLRMMAVTQCVLWYWGYKELAALMLAEASPSFSEAAGKPTARLKRRYIETLWLFYPHYQPQSPKASQRDINKANVAVKGVEILAAKIVDSDWFLYGPNELLADMGWTNPNQPYVVSAEIRQDLASLVIFTASQRNPDIVIEGELAHLYDAARAVEARGRPDLEDASI